MLRLLGGPFVESRYFGEGIGIAVRKGNDLLRTSLNWALFRIWEKGRFTDLWAAVFFDQSRSDGAS
jgi:polar amino acid transport system substrate-binding protein